jgi:glyoxalase superfamily protein
VPEDKEVKNRLHLDLRPADQAAEVVRQEALGARRVDVGQGDVSWVVMADPDGNEFDVLRAFTPDELAGAQPCGWSFRRSHSGGVTASGPASSSTFNGRALRCPGLEPLAALAPPWDTSGC